MNNYITWVTYENDKAFSTGVSVFRGTIKQCQSEALKIHKSERWQDRSKGRNTKVTITKGAKQLFAKAYILS